MWKGQRKEGRQGGLEVVRKMKWKDGEERGGRKERKGERERG